MKTKLKITVISLIMVAISSIINAQVSLIGNYTGSLPKIELSSSTDLERDVNLTIANKTITGKVSLKTIYPDVDEYINTINVSLKGEGIDIQTTTISCRTIYMPEGTFTKKSYVFDVFAGTINGKQINGYICKAFSDKLFGSVFIGGKELSVLKKSKINGYQLNYGDMIIGYECKNGMNKQGFPKITYTMAFGSKTVDGIINHNGDLKNKKIDYTYELSSAELSDEEISLWLLILFSSEALSERTEVYR
jgi:hypothetical protein